MNPHECLAFCIKKNQQSQLKQKYIKLFDEKKITNLTPIFFTWQWLTKYIFSSISKNPQAQKNLLCHVLHIFNPFAFSNIYISHKKVTI